MDDHRQQEQLTERAAYPSDQASTVEDGGAELVEMALHLHEASRWTATLLGVLLTVTVVLVYGVHAGA